MKESTAFSFLPDYLKSFFGLIGPVYAARMVATVIIVFLVGYLFSLLSPAAGEAFLYNQMILSGWMTAGFAGVVTLLILGCGALFASLCISYGYKFARNEIAATNVEVRQLSGGGQYYVGPDIVVVQSLDETDRVFRARVDDLIDAARPGQWIVELPFQSGYVKIKDDTAKGRSIKRGGEGGLLPLWGVTADVPVFNFATETESQYTAYINAFLPTFQAYAEHYRVEVKKEPPFKVGTITTVFLFLLLSLSATAQTNTDKVKTAVSANDFAPTAGQQVHYVFSDGSSATRTADGQKKISELFSAGYIGADNIQRGEVVGIDIDRRPVDIKVKISATGTNEKPAELFKTHMEAHNESGPGFQVPDSAATALQIKEAEQFLEKNKKDIVRFSLQWWMSEFASWLLTIISCALAISRTFGASAYNESEQRADGSVIYGRFMAICGHYASAVTFVLYWLAAIVLMPVAFFTLYNYGLWALMVSIFSYKTAMIIACFIIAWVFKKGSEKMVPNPVGSTQRPSNNHYNTGQSALGPGRR